MGRLKRMKGFRIESGRRGQCGGGGSKVLGASQARYLTTSPKDNPSATASRVMTEEATNSYKRMNSSKINT